MSLLLDLQLVPDRILWAVKDRILANRDAMEKRRQRERILAEGPDGATGGRLPLSSGSGEGYSQPPGHRPIGRRGGAQQGRYVRPEPFVPAFGAETFLFVYGWESYSEPLQSENVPEFTRIVLPSNQYAQFQFYFQDDLDNYAPFYPGSIRSASSDIFMYLPTGRDGFIYAARFWHNATGAPIGSGTVVEQMPYTYYSTSFGFGSLYPDKPGPVLLEGPYQGLWRYVETQGDGVIQLMYQQDVCFVGNSERIRPISTPAGLRAFMDRCIGSGPVQTFVPAQPENVARPMLTTIDPAEFPGHYVRSPDGVYTPYTGFDFYFQTPDYIGGRYNLGLTIQDDDSFARDQFYPNGITWGAEMLSKITGEALPPVEQGQADENPSPSFDPIPSNVFIYPQDSGRNNYSRFVVTDNGRPAFCTAQLQELGFSDADLTP